MSASHPHSEPDLAGTPRFKLWFIIQVHNLNVQAWQYIRNYHDCELLGNQPILSRESVQRFSYLDEEEKFMVLSARNH